ncbi:hypothetical protein DLAC_11721 [Tieghemostelium lacteum]|uniref:Uncharacterized protein n=1 Tax=Tieghemostelium lacteum TaxID=361077 RepID=A0A151Z7J6_TIELA|nr:hypothetical protein DLAC_11721 [Tieghemostelium lacteum]|eukprot:KYQ89905.1 hypothetical protein DLAC_11721 [Tieghemostelium lacteum]
MNFLIIAPGNWLHFLHRKNNIESENKLRLIKSSQTAQSLGTLLDIIWPNREIGRYIDIRSTKQYSISL